MITTQRALTASVALAALAVVGAARQAATELVSVATGGAQSTGWSGDAFVSHDGRWVVFSSFGTELVTPDVGGFADVFVRDRLTGVTERVTNGVGGVQANYHAQSGPISADGRLVVFASSASNLAPNDTNGVSDVFVRDRVAQSNTIVSLSSTGAAGNGASSRPAITPDARYIAFESQATNLVAASDLNGPQLDVFLRDRVLGTTVLVSATPTGDFPSVGGAYWASISADGRFVAFSALDGSFVSGDFNGVSDIFVRDVVAGTTRIASLGVGGQLGNSGSNFPSISADGAVVAYQSFASNLVVGDTNQIMDIFVRDLTLGTTVRASVGQGGVEAQPSSFFEGSYVPRLSADGKRVAFLSMSPNLIPNDTNPGGDVFVHDLAHSTTVCASVNSLGVQANLGCGYPAMSGDGDTVSFSTAASNLAPGDTNAQTDVFARRVGASLATVYCTAKTNSLGCVPAISFSGYASQSQPVAFHITAHQVLNQRSGLLLYGFESQAFPYQGGILCVKPPTVRTPVQNSGGAVGPIDCSGVYSLELNAHIQAGLAFGLAPGMRAFCQYWMRDPGSPVPAGFSDALDFVVLP